MKKDLIIIGCGGLAREICFYASMNSDVRIKGILADDEKKYKSSKLNFPYLGKIYDYKVKENDYFIIAFGAHPSKFQIYDDFAKNGAKFYTFIHPQSIVFDTCEIGDGVIIMPFCVIGDNVKISNNVFINKFVNIGHDTIISKSSIFSPYTMIGGGSYIGENVFFSSGSIIAPNTKVGANCVVSANTFIKKGLQENSFVFNNVKNIIKVR